MASFYTETACNTKAYLFHILNFMAIDDMVAQGARASGSHHDTDQVGIKKYWLLILKWHLKAAGLLMSDIFWI